MSDDASFWLFTIPNFALAAALYTLLGRYLLSLMFKPDSELVIWRVFCQITDPVLKAVRIVTPGMVPNGMVMLFSVFWLLLARILLLVAAIIFGFVPKLGG
ncbi:MAG: hypothetical protein ACKVON_05270 [Beijerinckiaceae bacterium]